MCAIDVFVRTDGGAGARSLALKIRDAQLIEFINRNYGCHNYVIVQSSN